MLHSYDMKLRLLLYCCLALALIFILSPTNSNRLSFQNAYAAYTKAVPTTGGPTLIDPSLKAEVVFKGLKHFRTRFIVQFGGIGPLSGQGGGVGELPLSCPTLPVLVSELLRPPVCTVTLLLL